MVRIATIVEGHGEVEALPVLLRRMAAHWRPDTAVTVPRPFRLARGKLVHRPDELERALRFSALQGDAALILIDSDDDPACVLGPQLLERGRRAFGGPLAVVLAEREFESWFMAAATSLRTAGCLPEAAIPPAEHWKIRDAKGWLDERFPGGTSYRVVLDQPRFAAQMDLEEARGSSSSFDKCCRDVLSLIDQVASTGLH